MKAGIAVAVAATMAWAAAAMAGDRAAGTVFRDCPKDCPEMVVVPAGRFLMGSPESETTREGVSTLFARLERPVHEVAIAYPFAIGKDPVTRAEFDTFLRETHYVPRAGDFGPPGCRVWDPATHIPRLDAAKGWRDPGFPQTAPNQPVVCAAWIDAQAFIDWLSKKSGHPYRLPSEAEWEYAARAGTTTARWWGDAIGVNNANCDGCGSRWDDRGTSPVGSFKANPFGLDDMLGNVWQWTADCGNETYKKTPTDGSARIGDHCPIYARRGGSWAARPKILRAADRAWSGEDDRDNDVGFRVARTLP